MPELREVFEMTTKQIERDVNAWREQEKRQRRSTRNKKIGAFAVAAAIGLAAIVFVATNRTGSDADRPAAVPSPTAEADVSDPFTGGTRPLPESLEGGTFYFVSPDRTQIVMNRCCTSPNPVSVANIDGTNLRQVTPDGVDGFAARWSPDGSSLVYQGRDASTREIGNIFILDLATGETRRITDLEPAEYSGWSMHPSFSADGQTIIFHMPRGPDTVDTRYDLWSVPAAGGEPTLVVRNASGGAYSPDGKTLAYVALPRGDSSTSALVLANVDGSDARLLVEGEQIESPRWSPNGTSIAYSDADGDHVVDVSTGEVSSVTGDADVLDWFDNDTLLVAP
jgi:dipeptidyl aminopeptidase/acylaminoacyl peptidase